MFTDWPKLSTGLPLALCTTLWMGLSWAWIRADVGVPDGDEAGHIGAAELVMDQLRHGEIGAALGWAWAGDTGEYPGLYPAMLGAVWAALGAGPPQAARALGLGLGLVTAAAVGWLARRIAGPGEGSVAFLATLLLPMANGLWRHTMPEGALVAVVAVSVAVGVWAGERPGWGRAAVWGLVVGAGLLTKQTFALVGLVPAMWAARGLRGRGALGLTVAAAAAGPWYLAHLGDQLAYTGASVEAKAAVGALDAALFYPVVLAFEGWGPALGLAAILGGAALWSRARGALALPAIWLLAGLLALGLVPKKYPRLLAPLTPAAALVVGLGLGRRGAGAGLGLAAGWLALASTRAVPEPPLYERVDPSCPQRFLGPPLRDDQGIGAVVRAASAAGPGPVVVLGAPEIPCELRSTHGWSSHLGPALRYAGQDREILEQPRDDAALIVDWRQGPGEPVDAPGLGRLWLRAPP